jgi:hypothetical protein
MLRERYDPMNLFEYIPVLVMETDAVLAQLDTLLDDDVVFQVVKADLSRRFPRTSSFGRPSPRVAQRALPKPKMASQRHLASPAVVKARAFA